MILLVLAILTSLTILVFEATLSLIMVAFLVIMAFLVAILVAEVVFMNLVVVFMVVEDLVMELKLCVSCALKLVMRLNSVIIDLILVSNDHLNFRTKFGLILLALVNHLTIQKILSL